MPVQFILGEHPRAKRTYLIDKMYEQLDANTIDRIIYLVPDNVKFEAETTILKEFMRKEKDSQYSGMIRLQVFSFSRLAWYLLQDNPIYQRPQLTETGLSMLLKSIIQEEESNLTIFKGTSQESGFISRLVTLFMELRNGKINPHDLEDILNHDENFGGIDSQDFQRKLNDLTLLYTRYDEKLEGKYLEKEDLYSALIQYIEEKKAYFQDVSIIVDHYEHFSAQELELLTVLAKYSKKLSISLTLDVKNIYRENNLNNPFYRPAKTFHHLMNEFQMNHIQVIEPKIPEVNVSASLSNNEDIIKLADYWMKSNSSLSFSELEAYKHGNYDNLEVWALENKQAEIMHIATKIYRMVASGNYRFQDFQIMTRDLESYKLNIEAIFKQNDIPYFIDQAESMSEHPLLEFIVSLFSLKRRHYRLDDILRLLRTELYCPDLLHEMEDTHEELALKNEYFENSIKSWRNKVDIAENVALAYNYQGNDWTKDEEWLYARLSVDNEFSQNERELAIQEIANEVRDVFRQQIVPFIEQLDSLDSNRKIVTNLYNFMVEIGVVKQLQHWRDQLLAEGALEEARNHEQAWDTFILLLDEFVEVLGDERWDLDAFISIMETGFEQATFSMVPPAIDQVQVVNFDLPKIETKKVVFIIGMTDSQFPKAPTNQSLLTDQDRELVDNYLSSDKYLATSEAESSANEPFAMYLAILQSHEKLIFTYPLANEESKENRISPYLARITNSLGLKQKVKYANIIPIAGEDSYPYLDYVGSSLQTFNQMIIGLRYALDKREQPEAFWIKVFEELYKPSNLFQNRIVKSLSHKNIPVPLTDRLAEKLYGKDLYLSVSQLETFYTDPYSHFLIYGLRLKERQIQELSALETGNFYHDALDLIATQLFQSKKDISILTEEEINKTTNDVFQMLVNSNKYRLSKSSQRMQFIFRQLLTTVKQMVWSIVNQAKRSEVRTSKTELLFGRIGSNVGIQGLSYPLRSGGTLHLRGKVDRVDTVTIDNQLYTGIVDYKSSTTKFDYQRMYYGLMMQMITYLDTVLSNAEEIFHQKAKAIGAFYSRVHNPYIDLKKTKQDDVSKELLKSYKLDGLIINHPNILEAVDTDLSTGVSPLYPIRLLANGNFSGNNLLSEEEFDLLIRFNRDKIIEAGNRILSGENMLKPFEDDGLFIPSVRGSYQAISQFDALLPENNYQEMLSLDKKSFFNLLMERYTKNPKEEN